MRYVIRANWIEDEDAWPADCAGHIPTVDDGAAIDTGLVTPDGHAIWRAPNPIGFVWGDS